MNEISFINLSSSAFRVLIHPALGCQKPGIHHVSYGQHKISGKAQVSVKQNHFLRQDILRVQRLLTMLVSGPILMTFTMGRFGQLQVIGTESREWLPGSV